MRSLRNRSIPRRDDLLAPFEQVFDDFFNDFFRSDPLAKVKRSTGFPKMDILEADGKFSVVVATSGMNQEDLDVEISPDNVLTIKGRISEEHRTPEDASYYLRELRMSAFERSIRLPQHVEGTPKAVMKDGLLTLSWDVPIVQEPQVRKISIESE